MFAKSNFKVINDIQTITGWDKIKKKAIQLILILIPFIWMKFGFAHKLKIFV